MSKKADSEYVLLLVGKSGTGKSATGNSILKKKIFATSASTSSKICQIQAESTKYNDERLTVVDGLDIAECYDKKDHKLNSFYEKCRGFNVLLFIIQYGPRFGKDDKKIVDAAKYFFGENVIAQFGIFIVTHGDNFKEDEPNTHFDKWIQAQDGLKELYTQCNKRFVLFNNKQKYDSSCQEQTAVLLRFIQQLKSSDVIEDVKKASDIHNHIAPNEKERMKQVEKNVTSTQSFKQSREMKNYKEENVEKLENDSDILFHTLNENIDKIGSFKKRVSLNSTDRLEFDKNIDIAVKKLKLIKEKEPQMKKPSKSAPDTEICNYSNERDDKPINVVLVGGVGNGKSATGNSILREELFTSKPSTTPVTTCFSKHSTEIDGKIIHVIDGPGIDASAEQLQKNLEMIIDTTEQALEMCNYNFSALLIVMKFGIRFTKQERDSVYVMKAILGSDVLQKYGICILTYGDKFQDGNNSFDNWCRNQKGEMTEIIKECGNRCILFNNKAKDEATKMKQVRQLMSMMKNNTQFSKKEFEMAEEERRKLIIALTFPEIKAETELKLKRLRNRLSTAEIIQEKNDDYLREINSIQKDTAHLKEFLSQMLQANTIVQPLIDNIEAFERELKSKLKYSTLKDECGSKVQAYGKKTPNTPSYKTNAKSYRYDQEQQKAQLNHQDDLFASPSKSTKDKGLLKRTFTFLIEFFK